MNVFPLCYFPPIPWFAAIWNEDDFALEVQQSYRKQRLSSRCNILLSNRVMPLVVPVTRRSSRAPISEKRISYAEPWRKQHWRSIESAYRASPYFEYYEEEMRIFFEKKYDLLLQLNLASLELVTRILERDLKFSTSTEFMDASAYSSDFRATFDPNPQHLPIGFTPIPYPQVFGGFVPGLSILDLIFNEGPASNSLLKRSWS